MPWFTFTKADTTKKPSVFPKDYDFEFPFTPSVPEVIQVCNDLI